MLEKEEEQSSFSRKNRSRGLPQTCYVCVCTRRSFRQLIEYRFNKFYGPVATIGWSVLVFLAVDQ